ncbi:hypothetical protein EI94DRAFT_976895 [Lactarius quietus]|nr:hypothetical protein EI94DRAFT_976895 [Lactarius quietus]
MSSVTINLPTGSSWVLASIFSIIPVLYVQSTVVVKARKRAGIRYPQLYAEKVDQEARKDAMIFNCAQRLIRTRLRMCRDRLDSAQCHTPPNLRCRWVWNLVFSRILYTLGYSTGVPNRL